MLDKVVCNYLKNILIFYTKEIDCYWKLYQLSRYQLTTLLLFVVRIPKDIFYYVQYFTCHISYQCIRWFKKSNNSCCRLKIIYNANINGIPQQLHDILYFRWERVTFARASLLHGDSFARRVTFARSSLLHAGSFLHRVIFAR